MRYTYFTIISFFQCALTLISCDGVFITVDLSITCCLPVFSLVAPSKKKHFVLISGASSPECETCTPNGRITRCARKHFLHQHQKKKIIYNMIYRHKCQFYFLLCYYFIEHHLIAKLR